MLDTFWLVAGSRRAAVVFTVPEKRLRELDVAVGPCVPTENRKRALVGITRQDRGETPRRTAVLFEILTSRPKSEALVLRARAGRGALYELSERFVAVLADINAELGRLADLDEANGNGATLPLFDAHLRDEAEAWSSRTYRWVLPGPARDVIIARSGWARVSLERGQRLYAWYGRYSPVYRVVSGTGDRAPRS
ncbi:MAG TPA: hypothetical protein PKB06_05330 [Actinotalea sp.]|nr:hypothetical protein [Actinotalea sp.]